MVCFISLLKCFELVKCSRRLEVRSLSCTCADALHQRDENYDVKLDILSWHTKIFDIAKNVKRGGCGTTKPPINKINIDKGKQVRSSQHVQAFSRKDE